MNPNTGEIKDFASEGEAKAAGFSTPVEIKESGAVFPRRQRRRFIQRPARIQATELEAMQANRAAAARKKKAKREATLKMKKRARAARKR